MFIREKMVRINDNCLHLRDLGVDAESSRCHGEEKPGSVCLACRWSSHVSSSSSFFFTLLQCLVFEDIHPFLLLGCGAHCHFASRILWTKKFRNSIGLSFLYVHVIIFPQGFCQEGLKAIGIKMVVVWFRSREGRLGVNGEGGVNFPVVFPVTFPLTVGQLWQLSVSQEAELPFKMNTF